MDEIYLVAAARSSAYRDRPPARSRRSVYLRQTDDALAGKYLAGDGAVPRDVPRR